MATFIPDMTPEQLAAWNVFRDQVLTVIPKDELLEFLGGGKKKRATGTRTPRGSESGPAAIIRKLAEDAETFTSADAAKMGVSANSFHGAVKGLLKNNVIECIIQGKPGYKGRHPSYYRMVGKTGMPVLPEAAAEAAVSEAATEATEVDAAPASKVVVTVLSDDEDDVAVLA